MATVNFKGKVLIDNKEISVEHSCSTEFDEIFFGRILLAGSAGHYASRDGLCTLLSEVEGIKTDSHRSVIRQIEEIADNLKTAHINNQKRLESLHPTERLIEKCDQARKVSDIAIKTALRDYTEEVREYQNGDIIATKSGKRIQVTRAYALFEFRCQSAEIYYQGPELTKKNEPKKSGDIGTVMVGNENDPVELIKRGEG